MLERQHSYGGLFRQPKPGRMPALLRIRINPGGHRTDIAIAATGERFDPAITAVLPECAAKRRDLHREITFLNIEPGPCGIHQRVFSDRNRSALQQQAQQRSTSPAKQGRRVASDQGAGLGIERKGAEFVGDWSGILGHFRSTL